MIVVRKTFMSQWTNFFQYFQVVFLISVVIVLLVLSVILFMQNLYLNPGEVFEKYELDEKGQFDELNPSPILEEVQMLSIIFRIVIILVAPASLYIYRSRFLTLYAFQLIKKDSYSH